MKKEDYFKNEINEAKDWSDIESLVNHLAKSLSKNIQVDFIIEYHARIVESSSKENELNLSDEDAFFFLARLSELSSVCSSCSFKVDVVNFFVRLAWIRDVVLVFVCVFVFEIFE